MVPLCMVVVATWPDGAERREATSSICGGGGDAGLAGRAPVLRARGRPGDPAKGSGRLVTPSPGIPPAGSGVRGSARPAALAAALEPHPPRALVARPASRDRGFRAVRPRPRGRGVEVQRGRPRAQPPRRRDRRAAPSWPGCARSRRRDRRRRDRCPTACAYAARVLSFAIRLAKNSRNRATASGPASTISDGRTTSASPSATTTGLRGRRHSDTSPHRRLPRRRAPRTARNRSRAHRPARRAVPPPPSPR